MRTYTPTPCLACGADCQDLPADRICPDCLAEHRASDDHASSCACTACQRRDQIDLARGATYTPWAAVAS